MGKGSGSARWAFLLLAGVLLAATAGAAEEDDGGVAANRELILPRPLDVCKATCKWRYGKDTRQKEACVRWCHEQHGHPADADAGAAAADEEVEDGNGGMDIYGSGRRSEEECRRRCMRRHEDQPWKAQQCMRLCRHGGHGQGDDDEEYEMSGHGGRGGEGGGGRCWERCERRHRGDWWEKQRCLMECREQEEGGGRRHEEHGGGGDRCPCRKQCERHHDRESKQRCVEACECRCRRRQEEEDADVDEVDSYYRGGRRCQRRCQRYGDWQVRQWCMQRCRGEEQEDAADDEDNSSDGGRRGERCEKQCQHYHDYHMRQQCMRDCHRGPHDGWDTVTGAAAGDEEDSNSGRRGDRCEKQCQHYHDYHQKQQCMRDCRRGHHDDSEAVAGAAADEEDNSNSSGRRHHGDRCERQCQHYHDYHQKQQCMHECRRGHHDGWETVAGAILEVV